MATPVQHRYLLIDGHSVIHAWNELCVLHRHQPAKARESLRLAMGKLHDSGRWLVTLVFDGKQGTREPVQPGRMAVIYSQQDQTADSIIERLTASAPDPARVWVVTADRAEALTIESLGATCQHPDWLRHELTAAEAEMLEILKKVQNQARW